MAYNRIVAVLVLCLSGLGNAATRLPHYYAHDTNEDSQGAIAPWYRGQNGQFDFRVRIAAETLKRYPWADPSKGCPQVPEFILSGSWNISPEGAISVPPIDDWANGDMGQRVAYILTGLVDYYRYSGDSSAIGLAGLTADTILDLCQTDDSHDWPDFLISVPNRGKPYGCCDPHGMIQLDIAAEVGHALLRAYQMVGDERWLEAATHWGEVLAQKCDRSPGMPPWNRYANPEDVQWDDCMTGGVVFLLGLFDELLKLGIRGQDDCILQARDLGRDWLRETLLPIWTVDDTWGRNYWDWPDPVQAENVTEWMARYLMDNPDSFPTWRSDARNILSLFLNRTSVSPASNGDVYSGAWAFPESSGCCGRSLWYGPMELALAFAQYGVVAEDEWGRELARRQQLLATYDCHETGVVEDNIDGGAIVAGSWFKIAHPMALKHVLGTMAWLPEIMGPNRENHILRTTSVVKDVRYRKGRVEYTVFDAPAPSTSVLRLAFRPVAVVADGSPLSLSEDLTANGYRLQALEGGDTILTIRHDGSTRITVEGEDPQEETGPEGLVLQGSWSPDPKGEGREGRWISTSEAGASARLSFFGNQVRVLGHPGPEGGLADVFLDGTKQLAGIDCWLPSERHSQILLYKNGLANSTHELEIVSRGLGNPASKGKALSIEAIQWSSATGDGGFGQGGGPTGCQRWILGYTGREDYVDSAGNTWRPATELITRGQHLTDSVAAFWWTKRRRLHIANTPDPELYRYGVHVREFSAPVTVGPGTYHLRLKFAETRQDQQPPKRAVDITINGQAALKDFDIAETAGGMNRAVDLIFNDITPKNGIIEVRLANTHEGEAILQALEVGPGPGGEGAKPLLLQPEAPGK